MRENKKQETNPLTVEMANALMDVCSTWGDYPSYLFYRVYLGPVNSFVFKFSNCYNAQPSLCFESDFWSIWSIKAKGLSQPAGYVFQSKGEITRFTEKAISSCKSGNSYDYIASLVRSKTWSERGLDLIKYEEAAEVITDLCTTMGVDVTIGD